MPSADGSKRSPVFTSIDQLRPDTSGHNLTVKVVDTKVVVNRPAGKNGSAASTVAECLVGDETGVIIFTARNEQVELATPGSSLVIRNAKVDMFRGSMRLVTTQWGKVELADSKTALKAKEDNNMSLVEYELVQVNPQAAATTAVEAQ